VVGVDPRVDHGDRDAGLVDAWGRRARTNGVDTPVSRLCERLKLDVGTHRSHTRPACECLAGGFGNGREQHRCDVDVPAAGDASAARFDRLWILRRLVVEDDDHGHTRVVSRLCAHRRADGGPDHRQRTEDDD